MADTITEILKGIRYVTDPSASNEIIVAALRKAGYTEEQIEPLVASITIGFVRKWIGDSPILSDLQEKSVQQFRSSTDSVLSGFGMSERSFVSMLVAGKLTDDHVETIGKRLGFGAEDRNLLREIRNNVAGASIADEAVSDQKSIFSRYRSDLDKLEIELLNIYEKEYDAFLKREIGVRQDAIDTIVKQMKLG